MKTGSGKLIVILVAGVLVLFSGTIGWLVWQNNQLRQMEPETVLPLPVKTVAPTVDPMEGWQAYSSEEDCFSFKYPEEVTFKMQGDLAHLSVWGPTQKEDTGFFDGISLAFSSPLTINVPLKDYVDGKVDESKEFGEVIKPRTEIMVNGIKGYTYTSQGMGTFENIYLQAEDKSCAVEITNSTVDPTNQGYQEIVDKILATFKFGK